MGKHFAVIMAGGRGERFWPLSTDQLPKPFVPLLGPSTLIQDTVRRVRACVPDDQILISIGEAHESHARDQLPQIPAENFIIEPAGRDTSACLGFAALHIEKRNPDALMLALPADHFTLDAEGFRRTMQRGMENLEGATGVVFGMVPIRPDTGFGYIQAEKPAKPADAWPVIRFVEKPDAVRAAAYLKEGNYFWNSGIFLWANRTLLELFQKHLPETYRGLREMQPLIGRSDARAEIRRIFSSLPRISIDYAILEKTSGLRLVPAEFAWDDIGNWASLERALVPDLNRNVARGPCIALESNGCVTYSDAGTVAIFGVSDLVVVQAHGKVLVCPKSRASDLKRLVTALGPGN